MQNAKIEDLVGDVIVGVRQRDDYVLYIATLIGGWYAMYHRQDCCEMVTIEDIIGDPDSLTGGLVISAEEATDQDGHPPDKQHKVEHDYVDDSYTWTFYKIDTSKGGITVRWFGTSNGYYSESVDFVKLDRFGEV